MSKQLIFRYLRVLGTVVLLALALAKAGLFRLSGWQEMSELFLNASPIYVFGTFVVEFFLVLASTMKWHVLTQVRGLAVGLWRLYAYYLVGKFFSLVLPSNIGGDAMRMAELGRYTGRYADATASVFLERFSGLATLVVLAVLAFAVNLQTFDMPWLTISLGIGALATGCVCWLILDERPATLVYRLFGRRIPVLNGLFTKIEKFRQAVMAYSDTPSALWWSLIYSLVFYFLAAVSVWFSLLSFGATISFASTVVAVPIIMFIMNIPFSIGGIGLLELGYGVVLEAFGVNPTVAISAALLIRARIFIYSAVGGLLYPLVCTRSSQSSESPDGVVEDIRQPTTAKRSIYKP